MNVFINKNKHVNHKIKNQSFGKKSLKMVQNTINCIWQKNGKSADKN